VVTNLLPTPQASDGSGGRTPKKSGGTRPSGAKRNVPLTDIPQLLPTPRVRTGDNNPSGHRRHSPGVEAVTYHFPDGKWGPYEAAVVRWEELTRPAPVPSEPNSKGKLRLNAAFSEWMMGWPQGWVTEIGLTRNQQLKIIGNGVVPQQAAAAIRSLL